MGKRRDADGSKAAPAKTGRVDLTQIRQLVQLMVDHELREIEIRNGQMQVAIRRGIESDPVRPAGGVGQASVSPGRGGAPAQRSHEPASQPHAQQDSLVAITSPMVGTFYAAPDPESPPYVSVGAEVSPDTVVCIVEAMKVFNEIKAEVSGTIEKVCVENAHPVEFGQPLFLVRPSG